MKIHFVGIGGIGVSALAQYYLSKGHRVSGSDLVSSEITDFLKKKGAKIFTPHQSTGQVGFHKAGNVPADVDLVIYSPAVESSNPELNAASGSAARRVLSYPQALGELTKQYFTIAVSGSHGKSTTTAMLALVLMKAGLDPTVIIGTKLKEFGNTNFRLGGSRFLIIEADEWQASFLNYWPQMIILTNIEKEHLDFYKTLANELKTFRKYIGHLPDGGFLVANKNDKNIKKILSPRHDQFPTAVGNWSYYSQGQKEAEDIKRILNVPGKHNIANALAVLTAARQLGISDKHIFAGLADFKGTWRRFEIIKRKRYTIISDYGHHPTEIKATIQACREKYKKEKLWLVFQPHQYQRTFYLFNEFKKTLTNLPVDRLVLTDIYSVPGRETDAIKKKVNSTKLVKTINKKKIIYLPQRKLERYLKNNLRGGEVVVIMGAGDIYNLVKKL